MSHTRAALAAALSLGLAAVGYAEDRPAAPHVHRSPEMEKCIRACVECSAQCGTCFVHCTDLVASGKRDHVPSLKSCVDCGDLCAIAAKIMTRNGALIGPSCDGCAKACDACATACEKFPDDAHMKACARACRDCAKACRDMLKSAGTGGNTTGN
jgi:hypothetical protein